MAGVGALNDLRCHHCQDPLPADGGFRGERDGAEYRFCCRGCLGAWLIITGAGLEDYYRKRSWQDAGGMAEVFAVEYDDQLLARHVRVGEEGDELAFLVEGIRCATCVWLIEKIVGQLDGVRTVRANYGSHRVFVVYDPTRLTPARLFAAVARLGYRPRVLTRDNLHRAAEAESRDLLLRFGTAFFLAMQLMGYSFALYAGYFQGMTPLTRDVMQWMAALVTTPVVFYSGWPFLVGAWRSLRSNLPNMDLLVAMGVLAAYFYSIYATVVGAEVYFETAAMIVTLILLGRLFEHNARRRAASGVDRLLHLTPDTAVRLEEGEWQVVVDSAELRPGDMILVRPGERFPVDGRIVDGHSEVDEAVVSGESRPLARGPGEAVLGGSINLTGTLRVEVAKTTAESFVARMAMLVEEAQSRQAPVQRLADRLAAAFVPLVLSLSLAALLFWLWQGLGLGPALLIAIAVLVVACPCALGLATPTAVLVAAGRAAGRGILYRGGDVLEESAKITHVAFDKTGTLTTGSPRVVAVRPYLHAGTDEATGAASRAGEGLENRLLALAAAVESGSTHPLAEAIVTEAESRGLIYEPGGQGPPTASCDRSPAVASEKTSEQVIQKQSGLPAVGAVSEISAVAGRGMIAAGSAGKVVVGNRDFLAQQGIDVPPREEWTADRGGMLKAGARQGQNSAAGEALTEVHLAEAGQYAGVILLQDTLRPDAPALVRELHARGLQVLMLSGDNPGVAARVAAEAGIEKVYSAIDPAGKKAIIEELQHAGARVLMVGDGINDAPALAAARVGCALAGGTDIAVGAAGLVLTRNRLAELAGALALARRTMRIIRENLFWAFSYNMVTLPLAVAGLLAPVYAAAAMAASSVLVVANSLRLAKR
ncbi:heavy metal translocating P-type ATPase [Desulfurivibrio dismutans]|uniref:heavy metal translocating P-type ATPase n=1 Tax=Desulfurivibrio dismutans TaxID=1398908 RepID=UPI0023DB3969|nr:heavy metal translocating P-type ATPase [Desulfurivibrio alkaliphilus]MDF1614403.1 heavy metal translocating P-type ATPase [Desulfurivibrio alkaliphilus]